MENNPKSARHRHGAWHFLVFFLFLSLGCAQFNDGIHSKEVEGKYRSIPYQLLTFESQDSQKVYPLLIALPGLGENPSNVFNKWYLEAEKNRAMVAVIDWLKPVKGKRIHENDLESLILDLFLRYPVDEKKLFICGTSAGGTMAEKLILKNPSRWKGGIFIAYTPSSIWFKYKDLQKFPPLFLGVGAKDPGGKNQELALKAVEMKRKGMKLHLFVDPEAGHEHREEWNEKIFDWMKENYSSIL